jgi:hypothetical protein
MIKVKPSNVYISNSPWLAPVIPIQMRLSQPEFGPASRIHPIAPRYGGVMNAPSTSVRTSPLAGMLVRAMAQAIGTAKIRQRQVTLAPSRMEFHIAVRYRGREYAVT